MNYLNRIPRVLRSVIPAILAALLLAPALPAQDLQPQDPGRLIHATVAEMVEPMLFKWKESYKYRSFGFEMEYTSTLQDKVFQAFLDGRSMIAPSARDLTAEEIAQFTAKWGYPPMRIAMAMDALVFLVHKSNPLKEIKMEQIDAAFTTTRRLGWPKDVTVWGDLGLSSGNWPNRPIEAYGHPLGSGTLDFFRSSIPGTYKPSIKRFADILEMIEELSANQAAIGYGSISQSFSSLRMLPVVPLGGKSAVEPNAASVADGSYPITRVLNMYVNKTPGKPLDPNILGFLRFTLSHEGQKLVAVSGFVPLPEDIASMNLRRLETAR